MPFTSETARIAGSKSKPKGVRKDAISQGLYSMVQTKYGTFEAYFSHLDDTMPGKPADMIAKYIPNEIEQTLNLNDTRILQVIMPEPRQVLDIPCEVRAIDSEPPVVKAATDAPQRSMNDVLLARQAEVCPNDDVA